MQENYDKLSEKVKEIIANSEFLSELVHRLSVYGVIVAYYAKWPDCREEVFTDGEVNESTFSPMKLAFCENTLTQVMNPYIEKFELIARFMPMFPMDSVVGLV